MKFDLITLLSLILLTAACSSIKENKKTYAGAGIGTAVGAGVGAIMGKKKGAMIGGVIGGGLGGYAGSRMDKQAKELEAIAETKRTDDGLVTKLKSDILFDTGKATLKPAAKTNLKQMADIMKKYPENVLMVKGFTDNTGTSVINEELSQNRAEAVKKMLVQDGLPESVISIQGLGPSSPIADNKTADGRKQNRRVEIEVTVDESKVPKKKV
ncbi:MAG TPA: OmpA family protein [Bacteriovoracaceae bacterium]|nr:OmpA family protein [Bacteriovoracaceae bacterium]